jgi:hypothetical protein
MASSRDESDILLLKKSKAETEQLIRASIARGKELANLTILALTIRLAYFLSNTGHVKRQTP